MKKFIYLIIGVMVAGLSLTQAQDLEVTNIEFVENKVQLSYIINDTLQGRYYTVRMYSSYDNFLTPLKNVEGDIGFEVSPGGERKIVWDAAQELGSSFNGDISLEVRGRIYVPFINIDWFADVKTLKLRHEYNITWSGGRPTNVLNFDLYKGETKVTTFPNVANVGHYKLALSKQIPPGNDYRFRISDTKNKDEVVFSDVFKVRRKIPLAASTGGGTAAMTALGVLILSQLNQSGPQETANAADLDIFSFQN